MAVMAETLFIQGFPDGEHAAVHHIRRGDDVGAGLGVGEGYLGQEFQGGVVVHFAVMDDAAVAVAGIAAEADVGDN